MSQFVTTSQRGPIAHLSLSRPDLHNAFNDEMIRQITEAFAALGADPAVRVIVLRAEGKSFSAGGDLNWMRRMVGYTFEQNVADAKALSAMYRAIRDCPKPVIARVHGAAYGGGVGLVAACDIAAALESARFCLSEVKLGLIPAVISPFVLEKISVAHARRYFLTAEVFPAAEARRIGLVAEVFPGEAETDAFIGQLCDSLLANGPEALAACKELIRTVQHAAFPQVQTLTARRIAERRASAEGQEGMRAFLEKRKPKWQEE